MCVDYFSYLTVNLSVCLSDLSLESFGLFVHVFPYKNMQLFVKFWHFNVSIIQMDLKPLAFITCANHPTPCVVLFLLREVYRNEHLLSYSIGKRCSFDCRRRRLFHSLTL